MSTCRCGRLLPHGTSRCPSGCAARRPGTITAVRVLLGLAAVANALTAIGCLASLSLANALTGTLPPGAVDAESAAVLAAARGVLVLVTVYGIAMAAFEIWAIVAIGARRTIARLLVTAVPVLSVSVSLAAAEMLDGGAAVAGVGVLFAIPLSATLIILLWVPASSREWFGDDPRSAAPAPRRDDPVTEPLNLPRPIGPPPAPSMAMAHGRTPPLPGRRA